MPFQNLAFLLLLQPSGLRFSITAARDIVMSDALPTHSAAWRSVVARGLGAGERTVGGRPRS